MKNGFFEAANGNKSSTRLISFITVMAAIVFAQEVIYFGRDNVVTAAAAAGTIFITIAGSAMAYQYNQKKNETKE